MALGPLVLLALWAGGLWWAAVLTLAATVAVYEWTDLNRLKQDSPPFIAAIVTLPAAQAAYIVMHDPWAPADLVLIAAAGLVFWRRVLGLGVLYIGAGWVSLLLLREARGGFADVLFVLLVVWANDIGAYLAGRLIGGRRMAPSLSPGKTWSGAGGGLVIASGPPEKIASIEESYTGQFLKQLLGLLTRRISQRARPGQGHPVWGIKRSRRRGVLVLTPLAPRGQELARLLIKEPDACGDRRKRQCAQRIHSIPLFHQSYQSRYAERNCRVWKPLGANPDHPHHNAL